MVGEAPAHNEASGRGLYAPLIGGPPLRPPLKTRIVPKRAMSEAETRAFSAGPCRHAREAMIIGPVYGRPLVVRGAERQF
jgi:hypothetical protein